MELTEVLQRVSSLATLAPGDFEALAAAMQVEDYPDGHVFIREGKRGDDAFLVVSGEVVVTRTDRAGVQELNRLGVSEFFGLVALVDHEPRAADCRAAGPCRVATLPGSAFTLLFAAHAPIALALQRALARQLAHDFRELQRKVREASAAKR